MALPTSQIADGLVKVQWVEAIADTAAPKVTEVNAASSFDATCYFTRDGFTTGGDIARVTDDRLCSRQVFEKIGNESNTLALKYIFQAQEDDADDNEAYLTLLPLSTGFFVVRYGIDFETAFATGQFVDVWPVELGPQQKAATAANETLKIEQTTSVIDNVKRNVPIVAGP
jgi:hypothetical protein